MSAAAVALGQEGLRELGSRVVAEAGQPSEPFGVYVFAADAPESELARHVEREGFYEYFHNPPRAPRGGVRAVRGLDRLRLRVGSSAGTAGRRHPARTAVTCGPEEP